MKVLVSAYACAPGRGSEPEVGLRTVLASAAAHETWVITRKKNVDLLRAALTAELPTSAAVHIVPVDLGPVWRQVKRRLPGGLHLYYDAWQRRAARAAASVHAQARLDVVHHATFAAYWARAGVLRVGPPAVWGPVGGAARPPLRLAPVLGWRGAASAAFRVAGQHVLAALNGQATAPAVVLVQNPQTARALGVPCTTVPNAIAVRLPPPPSDAGPRSRDVVFAGRLVPFKAALLAVSAMRWVTAPGARLVICGDGPERRRVQSAVRRWGLDDRVVLRGAVPREELLRRVAAAGVLLHPSLHEDAGFAVAEALALRTPVVCLDHAGPQQLAQWWPDSPATLVPPTGPRATARALAAAVDRHLAGPQSLPGMPSEPRRSFTGVLHEAYRTAAARRPAP